MSQATEQTEVKAETEYKVVDLRKMLVRIYGKNSAQVRVLDQLVDLAEASVL